MSRHGFAVLAVTMAIATAGACGDDDGSGDTGSDGATSLEGTSWSITSLATPGGTEEAPDDATLTFEDDARVSVATGCNTGSGPVTVDDDTITFGQLGVTLMACPPPLDSWEASLLAFLDGEVTFEVSGAQLTMTKQDSTLSLESIDSAG